MPSVRKPKTHKECLKLACVFCHKKSAKASEKNPKQLSAAVKGYIKERKCKDFEMVQNEFPSGLCNSCSPIVHGELSKKPLTVALPTQNFEETLKKLRETRCPDLSENCICFICQEVKKGCIAPLNKKRKVEKKKIRKCQHCFAEISPGKHKNCGSRKERVNNLMEVVSPKTRMQLCLETIAEQREKKVSSSPIKASRISGGPGMPISVGLSNQQSQQ